MCECVLCIYFERKYLLTPGEVQGGVSSCGSLAGVDWLRAGLPLSDWFVFVLLLV